MKKISIGTILVHSLGCGYDDFWQAVSITPKSVTVRRIESKHINRSVKYQTCDVVPIKDRFFPPEQVLKLKVIGRAKDGDFIYKEVDGNTITLKVVEDVNGTDGIRIGPSKRLNWWHVWGGMPRNQYSD